MRSKRLGITGTREVLSTFQLMNLRSLLKWLASTGFDELHHGDCVGADETAALHARPHGFSIVNHPPTNSSLRAYVSADEIRPEKDYLVRNKVIAKEADLGIALPNDWREQFRSGTWYTVRQFRELEVPHFIVAPEVMWFSNGF